MQFEHRGKHLSKVVNCLDGRTQWRLTFTFYSFCLSRMFDTTIWILLYIQGAEWLLRHQPEPFCPEMNSSGCLTKRTVVAVWAACICGVNCMYLAPDGDIREHVWRLGVFGGQRPSVCVSVFLQRQTVWARGESLTQRRYYMKIDMKVV